MEQILIVDDHIMTSMGLELLIKKVIKKCFVHLAGNCDAALRKLQNQKIDLSFWILEYREPMHPK